MFLFNPHIGIFIFQNFLASHMCDNISVAKATASRHLQLLCKAEGSGKDSPSSDLQMLTGFFNGFLLASTSLLCMWFYAALSGFYLQPSLTHVTINSFKLTANEKVIFLMEFIAQFFFSVSRILISICSCTKYIYTHKQEFFPDFISDMRLFTIGF